MRKLIFIVALIFLYQFLFAEDLWINPKWGMNKKEIEVNYKLADIHIQNLDTRLKYFFEENVCSKFKTYLVENKKFIYGEREFNVIVGFYEDKLQWIMIATDQLEKNDTNSKEVLHYYPKIFKVDKLLKSGSAGHNIVREFCVLASEVSNNVYYETQTPINRNYEQFTIYLMNNRFFKTLKIKKSLKSLEFNEQIITRLRPKEMVKIK